nr:MAG TPA: hypothetical protein [Caudoviricetes sp.]
MPQRQPPHNRGSTTGAHTYIHLCNSRLYRANLRLGGTPRHIATKISIVYRLDHARIRFVNHVRLHYSRIIRWNKPSIHNRRHLRLASHKRRATKRGSNRQYCSNPGRNQGRLPRQPAKRLRSISHTRSHPQHRNKRLHKSLSRPL